MNWVNQLGMALLVLPGFVLLGGVVIALWKDGTGKWLLAALIWAFVVAFLVTWG